MEKLLFRAVLFALAGFLVLFGMSEIGGLVLARMSYDAFLSSQSNVLACRSENSSPIAYVDKLCGELPTLENFRHRTSEVR